MTDDNDDNDQACSGNMAVMMSKQSSSSINVQLVTLLDHVDQLQTFPAL